MNRVNMGVLVLVLRHRISLLLMLLAPPRRRKHLPADFALASYVLPTYFLPTMSSTRHQVLRVRRGGFCQMLGMRRFYNIIAAMGEMSLRSTGIIAVDRCAIGGHTTKILQLPFTTLIPA